MRGSILSLMKRAFRGSRSRQSPLWGPRASRRPLALDALEHRLAPATLTVNGVLDATTADSFLALREAILLVNNAGDATAALSRTLTAGEQAQVTGTFGSSDTIAFAASLTGQTITLTSGQLLISRNLAISGPGANNLTVSGNNASRVFGIASSATVSIASLTIADGRNNLGAGGGIFNSGTLTVSNCTLTNNTARANNTSSNGGAIYNSGTLTVSNSTLSNNSAYVVNTYGNGQGGGIFNLGGTLTVSNSTFVGNSATSDGNFGRGGAILSNATLTLTNSTLASNSAYRGGGIANFGTAVVSNSIIANNSARFSGPDVDGSVTTDQGYNLIGNTSGSTGFVAATDRLNVNPLLGPLQNNGGPTPTMALLTGSPALGAGDPAVAGSTDQRGFTRGSPTSIGAYQSASPTVTGPGNQTATVGISRSFNLGSFSDPDGGPWNVTVDWGDPAAAGWSSANSMATARDYHTATLLQTGKVLVTGGQNNSGSLASAELYDPASITWSSAGIMATARYYNTATLLPNGKVLVAGGYNTNTGYLASAELYDPASNTWSSAATMATARFAHTATLLGNGKVLVTGGYIGSSLSSVELYDPASNTWTAVASLATAREYHIATLLTGGKVLVAAGYNAITGFLSSAELYDPTANTWSSAGFLTTARDIHTATRLQTGKVLVTGGQNNGGALSSAELYDPASNSWSSAGSMAAARMGNTETLLGNGKVLVTGGYNGSSLSSSELYDPASNTWSSAAAMATGREYHTATLLPNGKLVIAGGYSVTNGFVSNAELYDPGLTTFTASSTGSLGTQNHTYAQAGNYTVTVTVTDSASPTEAAGSAMFQVAVAYATTTSVNAPAISYGSNGSVTVTVTSGGGTPTGNVSLAVDGGAPIVQALSGGSSTFIISNLTAGVHNLSASYAAQGNFAASSATGSLTVNKKALTVTASNRSKTYGQTVTFAGTEFTTTGLVYSDTVGSVPLTSSGAAATATVGSYAIVASNAVGTGLSNYTISYVNGTLTVNTKALTITANNRTKTYGDTVTFAGTEFTSSGLVNGNTMTSVTLTSTGAAATAAAGSYAIVASNAVGTGLGNYTISYVSGTLTVNTKALTITANNRTKTYGDTVTFAGTEFTTSGLVNGNTVTSVTLTSSGAAATAPAGAYAIVPSAAQGSGLGNYTISYVNGTLTVNSVPPTVTPPANQAAIAGIAQSFNLGSFTDPDGGPWTVSVNWGDPSAAGWSAAASMATGRVAHTATLLNNGKVLVTGGTDNNRASYSSAEVYDPATNSWSSAGTMATARYRHTATLLANGKVLVTGGFNGSTYLSSAELYDPATNTWSAAGALATARQLHTATLLSSGKVLVTGGIGSTYLSSAELYDPATNTWSAAGALATARVGPTATLLSSGKVLVTGGYNASDLSSAELYDPATNTWSAAGDMSWTRESHTATLLSSGKVLVTGGYNGSSLSSAELYDPATNTWSAAGAMGTTRYVHTATLLSSGKVLVTGGFDGSSGLSSAELYDPATNTWSAAGALATARRFHTATLLSSGKVLAVGGLGGSGAQSSTDLYDTGLTTFTASAAGSLGTQSHTYAQPGNYTVTVTVRDSASPSEAAGSATFQVAVTSGATTTSISAPAITYGSNGSVTVTVTSAGGTPTGNVSLSVDGGSAIVQALSGGASTFIISNLAAGVRNLSASYAAQGTFAASSATGTLTVNQKTLTITATNRSKTYGDTVTFAGTEFTSSGLVYSDTVSSVTLTSIGAAATANAGSYNILASNAVGVGLSNYTIAYVNGSLTVNARPITVTANSQTKIYGNPDPALTYQITAGSLVGSDAFSGSLTRAPGESVASYAITQGTLALGSNYTLTYVGATLSITARPVTVTADTQTKVYGNADPALTFQISSGSLAFSDAFSGGLTRVAGESVGSYAIQQGTLALSSNYTLSYVGANLTVAARAITVTADAQTKTYGNADPALTYQITSGALAFSDTFAGSLSRASGENVGSHAITQGTLALSSNYTLTFVGANLSITPRAVTVTADAKAKTYGNADPALTYQITSGSLAFSDTFTGGLTRVAGESVGAYAIQQGTLALGSNYTLSYVSANLTVTARALTVTADAKTKTYGNADPALTYQITSGSLAFGDSFSGALTRAAGESVGSYAIQQGTLTLSSNYTLSYVAANFSITVRPVTVTAEAQTKTYGNTDPALTYLITSGSLAFGDTFSGALSRAAAESVGAYAITQGTLALGSNYTLSYVGANLSITARPVTVTADAQTKTYGNADPALTYQITSGALAFSDSFSGGLTRAAGESVGAYAIQQGTLALSSNYTLSYVAANLTITARPVTVTANAQTKTYGNADPALTYQITSGFLAFSDAFTGGLTRVAGESVGTYAIQQGTLALSSNYTLSYVAANLSITARPVTVTADAKTKVYGTADPALTYQVTSGSLAFTDTFTGGLARVAGENVGTYAIQQGTLALSGNYTLTYVGANLSITARPVTVTADAKTKTYGNADPALTFQISSGSLAFTDTFTGGLSRAAGESVGSYAITQGTLALSSNYALTLVGANLSITARAVTVTADAQTKTYGTADPALTYQITSGSLAFSDTFSGALTRAAGENVGSYAIQQGTLALSSNYTLTFVGANFSIAARPVTVTADAKAKTYGNGDPALTYQVTNGSLAFSDAFAGSLSRASGENVGSHAITQGTLALSSNYTLTFVGANLSITPRAVTVTADAKAKTYGNADPALTYQITSGSLAFSDTFTGGLARAAGENVGTYAITQGTLALSSNYTLSFVGANLSITPRAVTVTADGKTKVYGNADPALTYQLTSGSLAFSDTFTGSLARAAGESVGTYAITQGTLALSSNYTLSFVGANLSVTPRAVTVTADGKTKVYGNADPALTYQITSGSLAFSDAFTGGLARAAGESVGTYAIQQGTLALSSNYALSFVGANLSVTPRAVTVTADGKTKVYGNADPALTYQITNGSLAFSDSFTGGLARAAGESVGSYAITQGTLALNSNYTLSFIGANLSITPRAVTVTADGTTKTYGNADPALTYQITNGSLAFSDAFTGSLSRAAGENVGTYTITQGTLALSSNYSLTYVSANLSITPRALTVTADAKTKVYGTADPALTYQITSGSLAFSDTFTGGLSRNAGEGVGSYAITQGTLALSSNYTLSFVGANLSITPRAVTVTADGKTKVYGNADPALTYQITSGSLAFSDTFAGSLNRAAGENVGSYAITQGTLALSSNYSLTYVGANLGVTPRAVTVSANAQSKVYGNADPALTYQITNGSLVFSDSFSGVLSRVAGENVGTYAIQQGTLALSSNYTLTFVGANLSITPRAVTVTADGKTKVYGNADPALSFQITSGSLAFSDSFSGALTRAAGENVGSYAIQQGTLALSSNYTLSYVGAHLTVTARPVTVTADAKTKVYGNADPALTYQLTNGSLAFSDTFTGALTRATGENVGSFAIGQGTLALSSNYTLSYVGASLSITARPVTVTADAQTKTYGVTDPALTYQVTSGSLAFSDAFSGTLTRAAGENVGSYAIQQGTLALGGNYTLTYVGANLSVTARPVTVTADAKTKTYGNSDPVLTYQITSGSLAFSDAFSGALTRAAGENVGTYAIQQGTLALSSNYTLTYVAASLSVTARSVTVTADAKTKTYGNADPALTYQITTGSLAFSDTFSGALTRAAGEGVGAYAIQQGTLALSSNYALTYVGASLTISARPVTVTADAKTKTYGNADPALTYQITNGSLAFSDTFSGGLTRVAGESVGSYAIQQGTLALSSNYTLTYIGANFSINARPVTVTADAQTKVYGNADPALTYQITSGSLAFSDAFTGGLTRTAGEAVAAYAIQQGTLALSSNYALTYVGANLSVTARPITVTADAQTKVYGNADPALTYQITRGTLVFSDAFTGGLSRAAGENVGSYVIQQGTLALSSNYALTYAGANLTITPAPLAVTADSASRLYGVANPAFTGTLSGVRNGDNITATYASAAAPGTAIGTYGPANAIAIVPTLVDPGNRLSNYSVTSSNGTLTITPRSTVTTVSLAANPLTEGGSTPATVTVTDTSGAALVNVDPSGTLSVSASGSLTLSATSCTLAGNGSGVSTCQVMVTGLDNPGGALTASFAGDVLHVVGTSSGLTLTVLNVAPTAVSDAAATNEDQAVSIRVLANDSDPAGALDPLRITALTNGAKGTTAIDTKGTPDTTDDEIVYTPNAGASGTDTFTYTISDGDGGTATATVTVQIRNLVDVSGRVFDDKDNDGAFNGSDVGIGGVQVQLYNQATGALIASQLTAADGTYSFNVNLGAGTYRLVAAQPAGYLDGKETAGNLGGTVVNSQDSNAITEISVGAPGTTADAVDYLFAEIRPSQAQGLVWRDFNDDADVNFGEQVVQGVTIELTGVDDRGNAVSRSTTTDAHGIYTFTDLRPSNGAGYTLREFQPAGFVDGREALGTVNGVAVGSSAVNDTFASVVLPRPNSLAEDYNFGERPPTDGSVAAGQTATIGFWQNRNGQNLINALNGGSTATQLGNWLAATFPNMYGASAGANNLAGRTNAQVAAFYRTLFARNGQTAFGGGPPKMEAQVLATALAVYVTNQTLAGTTAAAYGFLVTANGLGTRTFNVGSSGAAFGVANNASVSVLDLLLAVNARTRNGLLYDLDGDGDANDAVETAQRTMANNVFSAINEAGGL